MPTPIHSRSRPRLESLESRVVPSVVAVGPEFQVNTYTTSNQSVPKVAIDSTGDFVICWESDGQGVASQRVVAQRYDSSGIAQGGEILIGSGGHTGVAIDTDGDFVAVWQSTDLDDSDAGIYARRYSATGVALGNEFRVNTYTTNSQDFPTVAMAANGDFVVTWHSFGQDGSDFGVYAQRYDGVGMPQGGEFRVNTGTSGAQQQSVVAMTPTGEFVIAWAVENGATGGLLAQRFSAVGAPVGGEIVVSSYFPQRSSAIAIKNDGSFVIAWEEVVISSNVIMARRFSSGGSPQGPQFQVNTYTASSSYRPAIAFDGDGEFVVAWDVGVLDGSALGVFAQQYSPAGIRVGSEFRVNTFTTDYQHYPSIGMSAGGDMVIAWGSGHSLPGIGEQDGSGFGVFAQRYVQGTPQVQTARVNDGSSQRSRITSLAITFNTQVTFNPSLLTAFMLSRNGAGSVGFTATANVINGVTVVTLNNFSGPETQSGSLRDGRYTLTALASQISANGQQMAANYTFGDAQGLFRFYGDMNGDRRVDISDFGFFSLAYLQTANYNAALDFNNDGRIDIADFGQFSVRFFTTLP